MRLEWHLTGRAEEMRIIEAALADPDANGIVVRGAAGVGKSRVAREALSLATAKGYDDRWVVGTSSAKGLPLGALQAWAGREGGDSFQLMRGVIESLTCAASGKPVVIGVDDVPFLDDLSTFVVHQVVQRAAAKVVLTIRDGEPIPPETQELFAAGQFDMLDLQPLSRDETANLASAALGAPLESDAARRIWELTRGNVLYVRNIVEQEVAAGRLAQRHGYWRWVAEPVLPTGLVDLIESRIGTLPSSVSEVVDVLAVGEPIQLASLQRITDPAAVEEAEVRSLIMLQHRDSNGGIEVRLAHPLYGEVRRRRAAQTRLRRLRGLVATELAAAGDRDEVQMVVRRATLGLDSDLEPDPDLLVKAAQRATWLADLVLADRLADAAARAGAGPEAYFIRAHALSWLDRGDEAEAMLAELSATDLTDADSARLAYLRANNMLYACADPWAAKELIDAASRITPAQHRDCIDAFLVVYCALMDDPKAAGEASKGLVLDRLPAVAGSSAGWAIAFVEGEAGRTTEALAAAEAGYAAAARSFDTPHTRFNIADSALTALLWSGGLVKAGEVARDAREQAADLPGIAQPLGAALAGRAALGAGQLDTACALLSQAVEALQAAGHGPGWGYRYQLPHAIALAMRGSCNEATVALAAGCEWSRAWQSHMGRTWWSNDLSLARAWVAASRGVVSEAIDTLLSNAEIAREKGQYAAEVMCRQTATQFGDHSCAERLRQLEAIVQGPRAGLATRFAAAMHAGDGDELAAVSDEFERMGDLIAAVDAAAHAAIAYRRHNLRGSALACSTRAETLARQCGGADTPALRQAIEPLPLTDREREIAMLLAEALSSRQIADRLVLSVRTVEGHIYRAMAKTDTTREDLAALVSGRKPPPNQ